MRSAVALAVATAACACCALPVALGQAAPQSSVAAAPQLLKRDDTVKVRPAPGIPGWKRIGTSQSGWRRSALPLSRVLGAGHRSLLIRKGVVVPAGGQAVAVHVSSPARIAVWWDGVMAGRTDGGRSRFVVATAPGRHVLALRVRRPMRVGLRVDVVESGTGESNPVQPPPPAEPPEAAITQPTRVCRIDDPLLPELSGMAAGLADPSILWVHNDSGDSARIFAMDRVTCAIRAEVKLAGVTAGDIEGIAMGRGQDGRGELWVGDVGDNSASRPSVRLYRFPEPTVSDQTVPVRTVTVTWDGKARNCESIAVDPVVDGDVFLVSKEAAASGIYRLQGDYRTSGVATSGPPLATTGQFATDAAIAPDRSRSVIRFYTAAEMRTGVLPGTSPLRVTMPDQRQAEAITFAPDSRSVYLASEGADDLIRMPLSIWAS